MAELLTPGVFVQEQDFGPSPIEGVSTSTAGFVGEAERGALSGPPTLVTSFADFQRKFGGFVSGKPLAYAVKGFFENGGRRAYIARVAGSGAAAATRTLTKGQNIAILSTASVPASTTQTVDIVLSSVVGLLSDGGSNSLSIFDVTTQTAVGPFSIVSVNGASNVATVSITAGLTPIVLGPGTHFARVGTADSSTNALAIAARDVGEFGDRVAILLEPYYADAAGVVLEYLADHSAFVLARTSFLAAGDAIQLENAAGTTRELRLVSSIDPVNKIVTLSAAATQDYSGGVLRQVAFRLTVFVDGSLVERLDGLPGQGGAALKQAINDRSAWVIVESSALDPISSVYPAFPNARPRVLSGGSNGSGTADFVGSDSPLSGLKALESQVGINLIAAPGQASVVVQGELLAQAERRADRFAILDSVSDTGALGATLSQRGALNSKYGALYAPWVKVADPLSKLEIMVAPSGHVAGAYARVDNERGVFKAPANVVLRGITGFAREIPDGEQDIFNPAGVNVLRTFDGLGRVIWGARTLSADGLWKYVPVRRLFTFLEQSIIKGTRFAVFEPNDARLWAKIRDAVSNFLTSEWRAGALFGSTAEQAFFVRCDETTTTQDDRDNGRINIIVGVAPVKPAEFIVFQIGQAPAGFAVAEQA